jgi:hypothetical protein
VDFWIVVFFWAISIFNMVANFIVYSVFPSYDLYNPGLSGAEKVLETASTLVPICAIVTIVLLGDRYLATKKSREQTGADSSTSLTSFNFKRRNIARLLLAGIITFFSLPWILAIVGVYISDVPLISAIFLGRQPYPYPNGLPSVHLGAHHGWDAYIFSIFAIVGSISLDSKYYLKNKAFRSIIAGGIVFLSLYAFFAGFEDGINEQLLKRGLKVPVYEFFEEAYSSVFFYPLIAITAISCAIFWYYFARNND